MSILPRMSSNPSSLASAAFLCTALTIVGSAMTDGAIAGTTSSTSRQVLDERSLRPAESFDLRALLRQSENNFLKQGLAINSHSSAGKGLDPDFFSGQKYYLGEDSLKDFHRAAQNFERAAHRGDSAAQFCLAIMMFKGEGVSRDCIAARNLLKQAKAGPRDNNFVRLAWYLDHLLN
jgi:TPR repeat protein